MDLAFSTKRLREFCEVEELARNEFGENVSDMLKERLADLVAARSLTELPIGSPEPKGKEHFTVNLCDGYEIRFRANHLNSSVDGTGKVIWSEVTRILILDIGCDNVERN